MHFCEGADEGAEKGAGAPLLKSPLCFQRYTDPTSAERKPGRLVRLLFRSDTYSRLEKIAIGEVVQDKCCNVRARDASYMTMGRGCHELH